ncbi:NAD(+) synthetase, partial [Francisella tularensis subsp. holarctica]|nr:NAD(+) synthetase [Francisella tularensis subsp. holarctica]
MKIVKDFSPKEYSQKLVNWLSDSCMNYPAEGFVIGLSGGIDSAVAAS